MIQLKVKDIPQIRTEILESQNNYCKLCRNPITAETGISLDHQHGKKSEINGEDGKGLVRGVLCRACNVQEGKIWNSMQRYIQPQDVQERIAWLESLVDYYKAPNYEYIHPSEAIKDPKLMKSSYNKLKKVHTLKSTLKFPEYPKSGKITVKLQELYIKHQVEPEFYPLH